MEKYDFKILCLGDNYKLKNQLVSAICGHKEYDRRIICCEYRYKSINIDEKMYNLKILNIDEFDVNEPIIGQFLECVNFVIYVSESDFYFNKITKPKIMVEKNVNVFSQDSVDEFFKNVITDLIRSNTVTHIQDENKIKFHYKKKSKKKNWNCF